jgi:uncharacterized membrane protein
MPLDLTLTPNRSLHPRHARALIGGVGVVFLLGGLRFLLLGAWPVIPFMLADLALLWWAFRASYRSGRAYERLWIDGGGLTPTLTLARVSHHGIERRLVFEPFWTRVQLETLGDDENRLWLSTHGKRFAIGSFLSPAERVAVHDVIAAGLARCRGWRG